jgi:hypothetical protein
MMNNRTIAIGFLACLAAASGARAQQCSTQAIVGTYVAVCNGYLSPGPNLDMVPAKLLGTVSGNYQGTFSGVSTITLGAGQIWQKLTATLTGTAVTNPDCTGSISYVQTIGGQKGPNLNFTFVISANGDRFDGLSTDPGAVFSCELHRISHVFTARLPVRPAGSAPASTHSSQALP